MTRAEGNIWSKEIIKSLMSFYMQLDGHSIWQEKYSDEALVIYQARARREWYDMGIHGEGINLVIINDGLLINIQQKIVTRKAADSVQEVSDYSQTKKTLLMNSPFSFYKCH
ncbi:hypothetical protein BDQ17DRAFT_1255587 [Cyathus striatus]|nr:hypothetical protein BDQ17DRAFT_1255587 [Cyathus striatus]